VYVSVKNGKGFKGLVQYQFKETRDKAARLIATNMGTDDAQEITKALIDVARERPHAAKPVLHLIASWHERDDVSDEMMEQVGKRLLNSIGMSEENHQYLLVRHEDTKNPHFHIVANRVGLDGSIAAPQFTGRKLREEATKIDIEQGFTAPQRAVAGAIKRGEKIPIGMKLSSPSRDGNESISLTKMQQREGMRSAKHQVYERVKDALWNCDGSFADFDKRIRKNGVSPDWSYDKQGKFNGASFTLMNVDGTEPIRHGQTDDGSFAGYTYTFKGSQLGPRPGLSRNYLEKSLEARRKRSGQVENTEAKEKEFYVDAFKRYNSDGKRVIVGDKKGKTRRKHRAYRKKSLHSSVLSILRLFGQSTPVFKLPYSKFTPLRPPRLR
jgi:hypothetical protein